MEAGWGRAGIGVGVGVRAPWEGAWGPNGGSLATAAIACACARLGVHVPIRFVSSVGGGDGVGCLVGWGVGGSGDG